MWLNLHFCSIQGVLKKWLIKPFQCFWMQHGNPKILMVKINSVYAKYSSHTVRIVTKLHTSGYFCSSNKILANLLQNNKTMPIKTPKYQFFDTLGIAQNWKSRHIINIFFLVSTLYMKYLQIIYQNIENCYHGDILNVAW